MAENVRQIPKDVHKTLTDLDVGDKFALFDEVYEMIEKEKDQDDDAVMFDCVAQLQGEERYFSFFYNYSIYGYEDHNYDPVCQQFEFTEVEKKIVPVVRWTKKKEINIESIC